jgi:molybdopterin/thiamine biosynthesis adenylyltransferase
MNKTDSTSMHFSFSDSQLERYSRQILLPQVGPEGQEKLLQSKVLVVGTGGLGSPVLLYLAAAGVGTLGFMDFDQVDTSNLQRQIVHTTPDIGKSKVQSALEALRNINPDVQLQPHEEKLDFHNASAIITQYDFVIDGTDQFASKYLINDTCVLHGVPCSLGGILRFEGQLTTVVPGQSGCYRCLFPNPPSSDAMPTCASAGILGPVAGILGSYQATECLKYLTGAGELLTNKFLSLDVLTWKQQIIQYSSSHSCPACTHQTDFFSETLYTPNC